MKHHPGACVVVLLLLFWCSRNCKQANDLRQHWGELLEQDLVIVPEHTWLVLSLRLEWAKTLIRRFSCKKTLCSSVTNCIAGSSFPRQPMAPGVLNLHYPRKGWNMLKPEPRNSWLLTPAGQIHSCSEPGEDWWRLWTTRMLFMGWGSGAQLLKESLRSGTTRKMPQTIISTIMSICKSTFQVSRLHFFADPAAQLWYWLPTQRKINCQPSAGNVCRGFHKKWLWTCHRSLDLLLPGAVWQAKNWAMDGYGDNMFKHRPNLLPWSIHLCHQNPSESIRIHQNPSESIRHISHKKPRRCLATMHRCRDRTKFRSSPHIQWRRTWNCGAKWRP